MTVQGSIDTIEAFAEAVRLVFKNAIAFNQLEENIVRIAAKECSRKFEERYRVLLSQFGGVEDAQSVSTSARGKQASKQALPVSKSTALPGKKGGLGKEALHRRQSTGSLQSGLGPRYNAATVAAGSGAYLPATMDGCSHQMMEMQRAMAAMQEEIAQLRTVVRENEVLKRLNETKEAAHNPLTFEEKKTLIDQIHKLPENKMSQILEIIQSSHTVKQQGDEEIEVPLDELDTYTLRKLQRFVEDNTEKKRRGPPFGAARPTSSSSTSSSSAVAEREPGQKRQYNKTGQYSKHNQALPSPRKPSHAVSKEHYLQPVQDPQESMYGETPVDDNEELLFEADSFEAQDEQHMHMIHMDTASFDEAGDLGLEAGGEVDMSLTYAGYVAED